MRPPVDRLALNDLEVVVWLVVLPQEASGSAITVSGPPLAFLGFWICDPHLKFD